MDFINCTKLPSNSQICFLDDQKHNEMYHENVLYINLNPYSHNINFNIMASKTYDKLHAYFPKNKSKEDFINYIASNTHNYKLEHLNKSKVEYNIEQVFSNVLMKKIDAFFNSKPQKFTKKNKKY
jgi:dihydrofolate reductase